LLPSGLPDPEYAMNGDGTRLSMYVTLVMMCNPGKCCAAVAGAVPEAARAFFVARMVALSSSEEARRRENQLSDRERGSILPWDAIQERYRRRRGLLAPRDRLVADLYLMCPQENPPKRVDYGAVRLVWSSGGPESCEPPAEGDYLVLSPSSGRGFLRLRSYKTHSTYGDFEQELPRELAAEVLRGLPAEPVCWRAYLLQGGADAKYASPGGIPMSESALKTRVTAAMISLTRVAIGVSNLRKSFVSHLLNVPDMSEARLHEIARLMMHSLDMQRGYRRVDLSALS
jgi:hypothetical protein